MSNPPSSTLTLVAHPSAPCTTDLQLSVALNPDAVGWHLQYTLHGDLSELIVPEPLCPSPADGLWEHTCFEAFVGTARSPSYQEFNFSPSGQWAAYRFSAERVRDAAAESAAPCNMLTVTCERTTNTLSLKVLLPTELLPIANNTAPSLIGLCAVVETRDGRHSYWALHHPRTDRPDFHHAAGWVHRLPSIPLAQKSTA
jgi:hypothetical protein